MTKARARQRAKANAARKTKKRDAAADRPDQNTRPGQFDPGSGSITGPRAGGNANTFARVRRGSARSR